MTKRETSAGVPPRVKEDFPIYRKHSLGNYINYTRINADLSAVSITTSKSSKIYEIQFEEAYAFDSSPLDYRLGRGRYRSSAQEFQSIVKALKQAIHSI